MLRSCLTDAERLAAHTVFDTVTLNWSIDGGAPSKMVATIFPFDFSVPIPDDCKKVRFVSPFSVAFGSLVNLKSGPCDDICQCAGEFSLRRGERHGGDPCYEAVRAACDVVTAPASTVLLYAF